MQLPYDLMKVIGLPFLSFIYLIIVLSTKMKYSELQTNCTGGVECDGTKLKVRVGLPLRRFVNRLRTARPILLCFCRDKTPE